jgi:hypothetical protein
LLSDILWKQNIEIIHWDYLWKMDRMDMMDRMNRDIIGRDDDMEDAVETLVSLRNVPKGTPFRKRHQNILSYVDVFLHKYSDLLPLFALTRATTKEITESMGAVQCLWYNPQFEVDRHNKNITCYVLGDGNTPRTASIIAKSSNIKVWSIDPKLKIKKRQEAVVDRIPSLHISATLAEDFVEIDEGVDLSIIVAVHSHAPLHTFWDRIKGPKIAIAIPCCVGQYTDIEPAGKYTDPKIFSKKNEVVYWTNIRPSLHCNEVL